MSEAIALGGREADRYAEPKITEAVAIKMLQELEVFGGEYYRSLVALARDWHMISDLAKQKTLGHIANVSNTLAVFDPQYYTINDVSIKLQDRPDDENMVRDMATLANLLFKDYHGINTDDVRMELKSFCEKWPAFKKIMEELLYTVVPAERSQAPQRTRAAGSAPAATDVQALMN